MRIFVVLILAAAFVGGWFIWSRDPLADVIAVYRTPETPQAKASSQ